ncbi:phosphopantetheine-binding protein, partial [Streptomyces sp. P17]|uniref:phosphopantetheine-binding protein n=1 Tax=Streptomyces sp. P17 TaxID=3074716 RepID=UPI0028F4063A
MADQPGEQLLVLDELGGDLEDLGGVALGGDQGELAAEHAAEVDRVGLLLYGDHDHLRAPPGGVDDGRPVPHGATGELHLGGDGLAGGYINDPERTAAVFTTAPAHLGPVPGGRLYRTGDLARWTEAGELRFLGRKDNQVKVRGFGIELGEIESVLREVVGLRDIAALALGTGADARLVCYVGLDGAEVTTEAMAAHLRAKLPHYMQPAEIIVEDRLPRLPNGKVDRKALAARDVDWGTGTASEFTDPDEARVARVWSELLGLTRISSDLDFFSVGGHSLLATLLAARLSDAAGRSVRVAEIYGHRTLAEQVLTRISSDLDFFSVGGHSLLATLLAA